MMFPVLIVAPVIVLILGGYFLFKGPRTGLLPAAIIAGIIAGLQLWAISQSRSSTAAIGIIFLPGFAALAMAFAWGAHRIVRRYEAKNDISYRRYLGYLLYLPVLAMAFWSIKSGFETRALNDRRDSEQRLFSEGIQTTRAEIKAVLAKSPGREAEALEQMIESNSGDDIFMHAAMSFDQVSAQRLAKLADAGKFELSVVTHTNVTAEIITKVYARTANKSYFYDSLASNAKTPVSILREIDADRDKIVDLDSRTAANPSTPLDILTRISTTQNAYALLKLIDNPAINCEIVGNVESTAATIDPSKFAHSASYLAEIKEKAPKAAFRLCGP